MVDTDTARGHAVSAVMAAGIIFVLTWATGISLTPVQLAMAVGITAFAGIVIRTSGNVTVGFALVTIAGLMLVVDLLVPTTITDSLSPFISAVNDVLGVQIGEINTIQLFVMTFFLVVVALILRERFVEGTAGLDKVIDNVNGRLDMYFDTYANVARAMILFAFGVVTIFFATGGRLLGEIGNYLAQIPFIVSNLAAIVAGWIALGGEFLGLESTFLGNIGPIGWLLIVGTILGVAAAVKYEGRGSLAQRIKRR